MSDFKWSDLKKKAIKAIETENYEELKKIVDDNPKIALSYDICGETMLHYAAKYDSIEILELLIQQGAQVDETIKKGKNNFITPLHRAVEVGNIKVILWLLEHGADINAGEGIHATPLITASMGGNLEIVKILIEHGADINASYSVDGCNQIDAMNGAKMFNRTSVINFLKKYKTESITENIEGELDKYISENYGTISQTLSEIVPASKATINVNIIEANEKRDYITLITTGMSDYPMDASSNLNEYAFAELVIKLPLNWPTSKEKLKDLNNYWPFAWIRQIAHIPHIYDGYIDDEVIIPNGEPPMAFAENTKLCSIMLSKSSECEGIFIDSNGKRINFYTLIPIYNEERDFALQYGTEVLKDLLKENKITDILDLNRKNVCK